MTVVNVLVLTDGDGSFQAKGNRFALTEFVSTLKADAGDLWSFNVTTAHRYASGLFLGKLGDASTDFSNQADIKGFLFSNPQNFPPGHYDEVLLFGFATSTPGAPYGYLSGHALSDAELAVLAAFMESGGGVFAVGDHDDLGVDLCGKVPRVRSMRRWTFDYAAITKNGALDYTLYSENPHMAPPVAGPHRHSTIVADANGRYEFDGQSDDIPQTTQPVIYSLVSGSPWLSFIRSYPHPLLCGAKGVIDVLPDHMHEGECDVPGAADLEKTYAFNGGAAQPEYPPMFGSPFPPQVVAWGEIKARHVDATYTDPAVAQSPLSSDNAELFPDTFGLIAAWDGHVVNRGRVTVDSTFHHFVNVNVIGDTDDANHTWTNDEPIKAQGFLGSTAGQAQYARIREYWRNIARWLAPQAKQDAHAMEWLAKLATNPLLGQEVGYAGDLNGTQAFGAKVGAVLARFLPPCGVMHVASRGIPDPWSIILGKWYILRTLPDPPPPWVDFLHAGIDVVALRNVALGAATMEMRSQLSTGAKMGSAHLYKAIRTSAARRVGEMLSREQAGMNRAANALGRLLEQGHEIIGRR
jgi:hypothetical protein